MAVDFGSSGNTTRYYSTPDHADFTFPATDWTWAALVYPQDSSASKYIVSTGSYGDANTFNLFLYNTAGSVGFGARYGTPLEAVWGNGVATLDQWYWVYASRRSGNLYCGAAPFGGGTASEGTGIDISAVGLPNSPNELHIGKRQTDTARNWQGRIDRVFYNDTYGATLSDIQTLSAGTLPASSVFNTNMVDRWNLVDSSAASISGIGAGHVITKQGSSYGANNASPYASATKGIKHALYNGASLVTNETGIHVVMVDVAQIGDASTLINLGKTNTTNASGELVIATPTSTVAIGGNTTFVAYKPDLTDHEDSPAIVTRTTLADIS